MDTNILKEALSKSGLVPGPAESLIPSDFKPTVNLEISFDGKAVEHGTSFRASECKVIPGVKFKPEVRTSLSVEALTDVGLCLEMIDISLGRGRFTRIVHPYARRTRRG